MCHRKGPTLTLSLHMFGCWLGARADDIKNALDAKERQRGDWGALGHTVVKPVLPWMLCVLAVQTFWTCSSSLSEIV